MTISLSQLAHTLAQYALAVYLNRSTGKDREASG